MSPRTSIAFRFRFVSPIFCCALGFAAVHGVSAKASSLEDRLAVCRALVESVQRLACYDALAPIAPTAPPVSAPALPAQVMEEPRAGSSPTPEQAFGAETLRPNVAKEVPRLSAHLMGRISGIRRGMIFQLDNGQRWKSIDDRQYDDYESDDNPPVTIERSVLGSYFLQLPDAYFRMVRVTRIE
jgi:hypothetical protein